MPASSSPPAAAAPARAAQLNGLAIACLGAVFFSAKAILVKLLYRHGVDAATVIALRMLLSAPFCVAVALWTSRRGPRLSRADLLRVILLGLIGYYGSSMLDFMGLQYISAGLERLILFVTPTFVLLLGLLAFKRTVSARQWLSMACAYAGIVLVFWHDVHIGGRDTLLGGALVFAAAFSYAVYLLLSGELLQRVGSLRLAALAMITSSVASLVQYAVLQPLPQLFLQSAEVWQLSTLNATLCTVLPVFLTMIAVGRIGAANASQAGMIGPVATLFLAAWLLGEPVTALQLAGTALVLAGIFVLSTQAPLPARPVEQAAPGG